MTVMLACAPFHRAEDTMNKETRNLFERIAKKMGWDDEGGLDTAEKKVCCTPHKPANNST